MNVLVTGGAGYIGSHAALRLLEAGHRVVVLDDLSRGRRGAIEALKEVGQVEFMETDIADRHAIVRRLRGEPIDVVMHFAALAYVGESVEEPIRYYANNTAGTIALIQAVEEAGVERFVFSGTCATYGIPAAEHVPIVESCPQHPINPYGHSKLWSERALIDYAASKQRRGEAFGVAILRYFNVAGSDRAARLGEDHTPETHLIPICLQAALGQREAVTIFGTDYPTPDGTCIRDYVHVEDLVEAHLAVMGAIEPGEVRRYNVGIGAGRSVREVIDSCHRVTGVDFAVREGKRRPGDPPVLYADAALIRRELGWTAEFVELDATVETAWRWMRDHPNGYGS